MTSLSPEKPARDDSFQEDARATIERIRRLFAAVVEAKCGGGPRAHEVADRFGVHRKLGWQIWNVVYDPEPLHGILSMPSERGLRAWRRAAVQTGLPADLLDGVDKAAQLYTGMVEKHASDRAMLEMLLETSEPGVDIAAEERRRAQAFEGNSYIWGIRASTYLTTLVVHPSQRAGYIDMMRLHGLIGLVRTRPNVRWPFAQAVVYSGHDERFPQRVPLDPTDAVKQTGVPLMTKFCSQPLPPVQRVAGDHGMLEDELLPGPMGQTGESTIITGEVARELAPMFKTVPDEDAMFGTGVRTPCQTLVYDHLVHRSLFPDAQRELRVYSELISPVSRDERDLLQISERIQFLGSGLTRLRTAEVPQYMDLLTSALECAGWDPDDFELYRVRMRYPPMPVAVMLQHQMPDAPDWFVLPRQGS